MRHLTSTARVDGTAPHCHPKHLSSWPPESGIQPVLRALTLNERLDLLEREQLSAKIEMEARELVRQVEEQIDQQVEKLFPSLVADAPRLASRVLAIREHQHVIDEELNALLHYAVAYAPTVFVRFHVRVFRTCWRAYEAAVMALVQDAMCTDLGEAG